MLANWSPSNNNDDNSDLFCMFFSGLLLVRPSGEWLPSSGFQSSSYFVSLRLFLAAGVLVYLIEFVSHKFAPLLLSDAFGGIFMYWTKKSSLKCPLKIPCSDWGGRKERWRSKSIHSFPSPESLYGRCYREHYIRYSTRDAKMMNRICPHHFIWI